MPADGEETFSDRIRYGMPDVSGAERGRYAGKRTLVVGSGHSAIGTVLDLVDLREDEPATAISWAVRSDDPRKVWGGGEADDLDARGRLGTRVAEAVRSGAASLMTGLSIGAIRELEGDLEILDAEGKRRAVVDEIVVATGSRPNLEMLRELRLDLDVASVAAKRLGPRIDPNHHSCGSVEPHGFEELSHPEIGFFLAGMKSYGRAPTFLLRTGYEQVRSIVAHLAGDDRGARSVELVLPSTGVCSAELAFQGEGPKDAREPEEARPCC
ncbi:MAG: hypothetical protein AAF725_11045 [Acidobacteriota bacterium]